VELLQILQVKQPKNGLMRSVLPPCFRSGGWQLYTL
jgi:hypothetical protein